VRVGIGYDVHRLENGRRLILGGVAIPYEYGLLGHSDADVLIHAVMDALLGAAALGDIGKHFPDTNGEYKDISSVVLLKKIRDILYDKGFQILNIDTVVIAQKPKISGHIEQMRAIMASALEIDIDCVSVKATTTEFLGFEGREEGISAQAICLIERDGNYVSK